MELAATADGFAPPKLNTGADAALLDGAITAEDAIAPNWNPPGAATAGVDDEVTTGCAAKEGVDEEDEEAGVLAAVIAPPKLNLVKLESLLIVINIQ